MPIPWAVIISLVVLGFALLIEKMFMGILEADKAFFGIIIAFFVVYAAAALAVGSLNPLTLISGPAS